MKRFIPGPPVYKDNNPVLDAIERDRPPFTKKVWDYRRKVFSHYQQSSSGLGYSHTKEWLVDIPDPARAAHKIIFHVCLRLERFLRMKIYDKTRSLFRAREIENAKSKRKTKTS